ASSFPPPLHPNLEHPWGSRPVFFPLWPRAGVSSAVLEVHVGTGSVFSVEGQQVVLPAWYTSHSQKKPYITWLLDKEDADPFQILTYMDGVTKVEETELKPRVGFLYPVLTHNISLFINATRERDSGQYMCTVNVVDDATSTGKNVGVINLTVLGKALPVTPAPPTPHPVPSSPVLYWGPWAPSPPLSSSPAVWSATGGKNVTARKKQPMRSSEMPLSLRRFKSSLLGFRVNRGGEEVSISGQSSLGFKVNGGWAIWEVLWWMLDWGIVDCGKLMGGGGSFHLWPDNTRFQS
uniref:Ig-like domain-containing protein n=1 Tax=Bubo bubo TaxID=30461 RepID=A0A8C0FXD0_BUBBB